MITDTQIWTSYMEGFNDELQGDRNTPDPNAEPILHRAYQLGKIDALIGDEVPSNDTQPKEEIISNLRTGDDKNDHRQEL